MSDTHEKRTRQLKIKGQTMFDEQQQYKIQSLQNLLTSVVYIKNSNYWTFFHKKVKTVNSKQLTVKKMSKTL
jgi:hypothetical protein